MTSTTEELAALFKQQSEDDIRSAYTLHNDGDYGNAAFHAQQASEKALKYIMMELDQTNQDQESLKKLRHNPTIKIIEKLMEYNNNNKSKNKGVDGIRLAACKHLPDLMKLFLAKPKSSLPYKIWWKISLEIELTAEEEEKGWHDIRKKLSSLVDNYQKITVATFGTNSETSKLISQMFIKFQTDLVQSQYAPKTDSMKSVMTEYSEAQPMIRSVFHAVLSNFSSNIKKLNKKTIGIIAISTWIAIHGLTILCITPHVQLGRYPDEISHGVSSYSLYKDHADQLYTLIQKVDESIKELYDIGETYGGRK